uniref:Protein tyrosine phosphatase receptor type N2 n=1 Tax=Oncorhynchus tshawytscha TaxID=74940 RepID=A0A8C8F6L9_ONCTS
PSKVALDKWHILYITILYSMFLTLFVVLSPDGMFGRCQSTPVPVAEVYTYDVSPSVVQRFRTLLQKLTHRGKYSTPTLPLQFLLLLPSLSSTPDKSRSLFWQAAQFITHVHSHMDQWWLLRGGRLTIMAGTEQVEWHQTHGNHVFDTIPLIPLHYNPSSLESLFSPPLIPTSLHLSSTEVFIQKVLKNVGRHDVDVDDLSPKDLDQLSTLITDALQPQEAGSLFGKLLVYLDKIESPAQRESPARAGVGAGLGEGRGVGLENVHSRTTQAEVRTTMMPVSPLMSSFLSSVCDRNVMCGSAHPHLTGLGINSVGTLRRKASIDELYFSLHSALQTDEGLHLMEILTRRAKLQMTDFLELSVVGPAVTFRVRPNAQNISTADVANVAVHQKDAVEKEAKVIILEAGITDRSQINQIPTKYSTAESTKYMILTVVSILCIVAVLLASAVVYCLRHRSHHKLKEKLTNLGTDTGSDATSTYQELCRQRMSVKPPAERPEPMHSVSSRLNSVSSQFSDGGPMVSPSARSSTSSWSEEPVHSNMDISTGHMILSYMEDHLKNKNRLEKEWEALCAYQAEPNASTTGLGAGNTKKNRSNAVVAYDHSRITLKVENSHSNSDYINASPIMDHDPRNPAYIATQGPLPSTVADFWQMVWENGCVVIVMLTPLTESGVKQCYHYWPDEGSNLYHIYEVNLVSEHIWCDDFLVRSFYLKNMQTNETRTVTQFHFLTWLNQNVPESSRTLLDFRRKVNKCYRGRSCPIIVHCSNGAGRSGTYILIDMVLNKMAKGAKEIDIAATLEHLRDQRPAMVQTKEQFEFALTAVAEEVNAILKALPQ